MALLIRLVDGSYQLCILLSRQDRQIKLSIEVKEVGFAVAQRPPGRLGLAGMRECIAAQGSTLEIESAPGEGTTVLASVDMQAGAAPVAKPPRMPAVGLARHARVSA